MGKRRIRNLLKLGYRDIIGFDTRADRRNEASKNYGIKTISNIGAMLVLKPDVLVISTPPDLHLKYANIAIKNNINFFTELNLLSKDVKKIVENMYGRSIIGLPSSTMRFHPMVIKLKELLDKKVLGKIYTVYHHTGQFLPNWHPWENYREFFVSKRETGGARELVAVELVWLTQLFPNIKSVYGNVTKVSKLEVDIDDVYQIFLELKNNIFCTLMIDVVSIPAFRETKIIGEKGTILCNFKNGIIRINKGKEWKNMKIKMGKIAKEYSSAPPETMYEKELQSFLNTITKKTKCNFSLRDEFNMLKILDKIEISNKNGKKFILN